MGIPHGRGGYLGAVWVLGWEAGGEGDEGVDVKKAVFEYVFPSDERQIEEDPMWRYVSWDPVRDGIMVQYQFQDGTLSVKQIITREQFCRVAGDVYPLVSEGEL